ncbi:hypothetical protein ABIB25_000981 [Nakamurella sp. UYEF19]|uniref:zeta toxin family protein n=1 Tax=Nakamurella sp. UYEF19 TaxID=1756392 RepID=UPI003390CC40
MTEPPTSRAAADFQDLVLPLLFDSAAPAAEPVLVMITGQPGAGTAAAARSAELMWPQQQFVTINGNELAALRPEWATAQTDPFTARATVSAGVREWIDQAVEHGRERRVAMMVDGGGQDPATLVGYAQRCAASGYLVHLVAMAVPSPVSRLREAGRFYVERALGGPGRWVSTGEHDIAYPQTPMAVAAAQVTAQVQRITVLNQVGEVVADNERDGAAGPWKSPPTAAKAMVELRWQRPTPEAANAWLTSHRQVLAIANTAGHNRATRETFTRLGTEATWTFESMSNPDRGVPPVLPMNPRFEPSQ